MATLAYLRPTRHRAPHCQPQTGGKKKRASLPVSLSDPAISACDKTRSSCTAVLVTCIKSCIPPLYYYFLALIYTNYLVRVTVSRWDRLLVFGACNLAALVCFILCFALLPILWPVPRKFAILFVSPLHMPPRPRLNSSHFERTRNLRHASTHPLQAKWQRMMRLEFVSGNRRKTVLFAYALFQVMHLLSSWIRETNTDAIMIYEGGLLGQCYSWHHGQS